MHVNENFFIKFKENFEIHFNSKNTICAIIFTQPAIAYGGIVLNRSFVDLDSIFCNSRNLQNIHYILNNNKPQNLQFYISRNENSGLLSIREQYKKAIMNVDYYFLNAQKVCPMHL